MDIETCLSLCEFLPKWNDKRLIGRIERCIDTCEICTLRHIHIGSSFCARLFFSITSDVVSRLARWCLSHDITLVLVLPIFSEALLDDGIVHARTLISSAHGALEEITVNDFGQFMYWGAAIDNGLPLHMNLGRLMNKDTRDPRNAYYSRITYVPRLLERDWCGWNNLDRILKTWPVSGIEFDPTHDTLDLSTLPTDIIPALHGPLCYMSTAQICEFASIGVATEHKFRPNMPCALQCLKTSICYTGASNVEFIKLGRTVYFDPNTSSEQDAQKLPCRLVNTMPLRYIYCPIQKVLS